MQQVEIKILKEFIEKYLIIDKRHFWDLFFGKKRILMNMGGRLISGVEQFKIKER